MKLTHLFYILAAICIASCDSGDIVEKAYTVSESGRTIKVTGKVSGLSEWESTGYILAVSGFTPNNKFAVVQRALPISAEKELPISLILSNLSNEIETVELALTNSLRKRVISLAVIDMADHKDISAKDTIRFDIGTLDVGRFGVLQAGLFNRACIQCHGENGRAAAGLDLTESRAKEALVDVPSTCEEGFLRVASGSAENSLLHLILNEGGENLLSYNHREILSSQFKTNFAEIADLVDQWIELLTPQSHSPKGR